MSTVDIILSNFIDLSITFIVPVLCTYGIISNIINIIIFSKKSMNDIIFKYYKINAISNICYLSIVFFLFVARCGIYCQLSKTYPAQLYLYVFYTYIKGIFAILSICVQITISLNRLLIVCNKKIDLLKNKLTTIIISMLIFSAVFYSPILFTKTIQTTAKNISSNNNNTIYTYSMVNNYIGNSNLGKWLIIIVTVIRGFIALILIICIDISTLIKLKLRENMRSLIMGISSKNIIYLL
jgi:hypothetical protein